MTARWLPLAEAAAELDISVDAARMRIKRGTLTSEKRSGKVFVRLNTDQTPTEPRRTFDQTSAEHPHISEESATEQRPNSDQTELVEAQRAEIQFLREELEARREEIRRRDVLVAQQQGSISRLAEQVQVLSSGEPEPAVMVDQGQPERRRSWWDRLLGRSSHDE